MFIVWHVVVLIPTADLKKKNTHTHTLGSAVIGKYELLKDNKFLYHTIPALIIFI